MLLLAPLTARRQRRRRSDRRSASSAQYVDIMLARRVWNFRSIAYSTMQYAMFLVMRDIRGLDPEPLAQNLHGLSRKRLKPSLATNDCASTNKTATRYIAYSPD